MTARGPLIDRLSAELTPARRLRRTGQLALLWLAGAWLFTVAAGLSVAPMRPGFAEQLLASPRFAAETLLGLVAGAVAIAAGFRAGIPGAGSARRLAWGSLSLLGAWTLAYVYGLHSPSLEPSTLGARPLCFAEVMLYGAPLLLGGLLLLRRLAPLDRVWTGAIVGAAAGAVPALFMELGCMYVPAHILVFHIAPIVPVILLGAATGPWLLRRI